MIAALPMYDRAEVTQANDTFWATIQHALGYGPKSLTRGMDVWDIWQSPNLLLAQTCGYPYRARLHGHVTLIGTPDYGLPDCPAGYYNSIFVRRRDDPRHSLHEFANATFAYNEPMSQSGWAAPMLHMGAEGLTFGAHIQSGAHVKSAQMVAKNQADITAIDAVTWVMIEKYDSFANRLQVVACTAPTPGLPYISTLGADRPALFKAIQLAIRNLCPTDRDTLQIKDLIDIPAAEYLAIPTPNSPKAQTS